MVVCPFKDGYFDTREVLVAVAAKELELRRASGEPFSFALLSDDGGSGFAKRALNAVSRPHGLPESRASHAMVSVRMPRGWQKLRWFVPNDLIISIY